MLENKNQGRTENDVVKDQLKNVAKKQAKKAVRKGAKRLLKRIFQKGIVTLFKALMKVIVAGLSSLFSLLLPVLPILLLVITVFIAVSLLFSWGSSNLDEDSYAEKLADYIVELSNESVNMEKPEQIPYRVPEDLLTASSQIYDSMLLSEDEDYSEKQLYKHEKKLVKKVAKELEPEFKYETIKTYTETETTVCNGSGCNTSTSKNESSQEMLVEVFAWDRIVKFDNEVEVSDWSAPQTSSNSVRDEETGEVHTETVTTRTRTASVNTTSNGTIDYTKFDNYLKKKFDYTEEDLKAVEGIYKVLGNSIVSTAAYAVNGVIVTGSGYDVRTKSGVTAAQINAGLSGLLSGKGAKFIEVGEKNGIDPAFIAAVAMAETGGNSKALREKNNIGGIMLAKGGLRTFGSIEECLEYMGQLFSGKLYVKAGLVTVEQIHNRYSPDGATNDPKNLNSNWVTNVYSFMAKMGVSLTKDDKKEEENSEKTMENKESTDTTSTPSNETASKEESAIETTESAPATFKTELQQNPIYYSEWLEGKDINFFELGANSGNVGAGDNGENITPGSSVDTSKLDKSKLGLIHPANGKWVKTSNWGARWGTKHFGIDLAARPQGSYQEVLAVAEGTVSKSYYSSSYGEVVFVKHNINGQQYESVYAHMRSGSRKVKVGQKVSQGQILGVQGNTGGSSGQHLHFEWHVGSWNINKTNAVNPELVLPM